MTLRELSSLEQYFYYRCKLQLHSCFYLATTLNKIPPRTIFEYALQETIKKYPQAHCTVTLDAVNVTPNIKELSDSPIYFDDVVEYCEWDSLDTEKMNTIFKKYNFAFDNGRPLWKIIVLEKSNQLIFALSHIFFDGMSSTIFATTFLENLNRKVDDSKKRDNGLLYTSRKDVNIPPHAYDLWPVPLAWKIKRQLVKLLLKVSPGVVTGTDKNLLQFENYNFPDDFVKVPADEEDTFTVKNDNLQRILRFSPEQLKTILSKCKEEKVSLTSFLGALFSFGLNNVSSDVLRNGKSFSINIPMNTRPICKEYLNVDESSLQLGDFIIGMEYPSTLDTVSNETFWSFATKINEYILDNRQNQISDQINTAKLLDVANVKSYVRQKVENAYGIGPGAAFEVTNLGYVTFGSNSIEEDKNYYVTDAFFNQPQGFSNIFTCSIITTAIGGLTCSISYPKSLVVEMEPIWSKVDEIIEKISSSI
ncbi:N-acetyltransferase [Maudiozyma barnettii]|uniref:Similar to Saccharomyces cerevisiae YGR212W SLI1 N-acetyltransferase n=1 Tax=Maudiozyma barnettii TaxID=61262 RepID=A0A8H2VIN6_9SACH|nr:N-acetyltransferase [Kazachstania barnettii]CAB4256093.1 similar to Saccharomyces cerevisiae YGR212W SLI1 N-acetyltransferase [Kazachstania barnettii]